MTYNEIRKRQAGIQMDADGIEQRAQQADANARQSDQMAQQAQVEAQAAHEGANQVAQKNQALEAYMQAITQKQQQKYEFARKANMTPEQLALEHYNARKAEAENRAVQEADLNAGIEGMYGNPEQAALMQNEADMSQEALMARGRPDPRSEIMQNPGALAKFMATRQQQ